MINNFDIVFYTLLFIVPGFIIHSVYTAFIKIEKENMQISLIKFLFCGDKGIIRNILQTIGFNPIHVIPAAWDFKVFSIV